MQKAEAIAKNIEAFAHGAFVGRVWREGVGPCLATLRKGRVIDITSNAIPTMRDLCEMENPAAVALAAEGDDLGTLDDLLSGDSKSMSLLAPIDLQAIKAAGVTFASSMLERVIEEKARGDAAAEWHSRRYYTADR